MPQAKPTPQVLHFSAAPANYLQFYQAVGMQPVVSFPDPINRKLVVQHFQFFNRVQTFLLLPKYLPVLFFLALKSELTRTFHNLLSRRVLCVGQVSRSYLPTYCPVPAVRPDKNRRGTNPYGLVHKKN